MKKLKVILSYLINNIKLIRFKKIGKRVCIGKGLIINGTFKENIVIGNDVTIGRYSRLGNTFKYGKGIIIGDNCFIGNNFTAIDGEIVIDNQVLIASNVSIVAANHNTNPTYENGYMNKKTEFYPVHIKESCWIGQNVCILSGVTIGEHSIIGAESIVTKNIPPYSMAVGNPAKVIKKFSIEENKWIKV